MEETTKQDIELKQTIKVFDTLADIIKNGSVSYRTLIYDYLDFYGYYGDLISGLTITNSICELEELRKTTKDTIQELETVEKWLKEQDFDDYYPTLQNRIDKLKGILNEY